ncbi:unnamed protein product [Pieris brassicae]|uniref:Uncharacterized protein n=1 Tax=Pieris brassicae TaxID=7116 RepID=A0A9P0T066_PIEBR|nr:unnamed protein product [Pieris brassicae]
MWVALCLGLVIGSFAQDYKSLESEIDLPTHYNRQYDNIDGLKPKDPIEDLTSSSKNGIDILSLYNGQKDGSNNTDSIIQNLVELGKNATQDDTDYVERPCKIFDKNCIRRYFAAHSLCTPKYQAVPEPVYRSQSTLYLPRVNTTVNSLDIYYTGATARIIEFYVNKKTNRLLLAFTFTNFTATAENNYFRFNRRGKEPVVIRSSRIFFQYYPNVQRTLVELLLRPDMNLQEAFLISANFYANTFIQQSICDFGLILS